MINETHVSFEIAKLLKEKGFDEKTDYIYYYYEEDDGWCFEKLLDGEKFKETKMLHSPTHQMAMAWLREEKNWYIDIRFNRHYQYYVPIIYNMRGTLDAIADLQERPKTYEEAVETALKYSLENLI